MQAQHHGVRFFGEGMAFFVVANQKDGDAADNSAASSSGLLRSGAVTGTPFQGPTHCSGTHPLSADFLAPPGRGRGTACFYPSLGRFQPAGLLLACRVLHTTPGGARRGWGTGLGGKTERSAGKRDGWVRGGGAYWVGELPRD